MKRNDSYLKLFSALAPTLSVALAFALRVHLLDQQSLWWDEIKTLERATASVQELMVDIVYFKRGHVPLYFLLTQLWAHIGTEPFVMRYFSVLAGTAAVALLFHLGTLLGKRRLATLSAFLLAISPFHIWYSQEARMYSLVTALAIGGAVCFVYAVRTNQTRWWLLYTLTMTAALYTHYFLLLVLFVHALYVALSFRQNHAAALRWSGAAFVSGTAILLYALVVRSGGGYSAATPGWIEQARWYEPFLTLVAYSAGPTVRPDSPAALLLAILFSAGLVASFAALIREKPPYFWRMVRFWLFAPLLIVYIVSLGLRAGFSLYMDRYLIIVLPAFFLLVARGLLLLVERVPVRRAPIVGALLVTLLTLPGLRNLYQNETHFRSDIRRAVQTVSETAAANPTLLGTPDVELPFAFYAEMYGVDYSFVALPIDPTTGAERRLFAEAMAAQVANAAEQGGDIWYLRQTFNRSPHGFAQTSSGPDVRAAWLFEQLGAGEQFDYPGVTLFRFDLDKP